MPRSKPHWTLALWLRIQEPRVVTAMQTMIYALVAVGGLMTILQPPTSFEGTFGAGILYTWGTFALAGGLLGAYAAPGGKWLIEKPAIIACVTAIGIYAGIILTMQLTTSGNRITQLVFVLIGLLHFIGRYARIRPYSYEPGK